MESIAAVSGVVTQTLYYLFKTKSRLLREVVEFAGGGGSDPVPVMEREWMREALTTADAKRAIALIVDHGVDIYARVAPLWPVVRTAASGDKAIDEYWHGVTQGRRQGMRGFAASLASRNALRADVSVERAADVLFVLDSHETFLGFTRDAGWSLAEYKAWLADTLCEQLLRP
jgi:AcrR family transcriptional regulator